MGPSVAMAAPGRREPPDAVQQNQLLCERVRKELQCQKLYTKFTVNPLHRVHTITRKPMSWHDNIEEAADAQFLNLIHHAALEPTKKYSEPQTESQEIGWNTTPLIPVARTDYRLYFPRRSTDITKQTAMGHREKQSENLQ